VLSAKKHQDRHAAKEWRHPGGMDAFLDFWIPAIHARMTA
jgi:hypothetical protein